MERKEDLIPQLRVVMNTTCGKHCCYCRPSGEAACPVAAGDSLSVESLFSCIRHLVKWGISEVRLTGGDPAFYPHDQLLWLVSQLGKLDLYRLSLVTRSHKIGEVLPNLKQAGLTHITFSLDSMDAQRWTDICGIGPLRIHEHSQLLDTIALARRLGFEVNLNCVLLEESCSVELPALVEFAQSLGIGLKVEEVIRDIGTAAGLHADLEPLKTDLRIRAKRTEMVCVHGGLGHPMEVIHMEGGTSVTWKMFKGGACYGDSCRQCGHFPCDDALMALRLLPNGKLQTCLKREDNLVDLYGAIQEHRADPLVRDVLRVYRDAERYSFEEIERFREARREERNVA